LAERRGTGDDEGLPEGRQSGPTKCIYRTYDYFSDALDDPQLKEYPQHGTFTLDGCLLALTFPNGDVSHVILTQRRGHFMMWSPKDYDEYLRTGRVPESVLYQQPAP
jgi:hypothetical protein